MNQKRFLLALLIFLLWQTPGVAQQVKTDNKVFNAEHFTLDNGLEIIVIPNHRAPVVTHMVWYRVGAADEPSGKSGIAHFLEHLMFKGSAVIGGKDLAAGEFSKKIKSLGGQDNAFTSQDYTAYYQSVAAEHLETVMRMEAGRMRGLKMAREDVESERNVILEERRQRTENNPAARLDEEMSAALFVNHPYGTPVIGWYHEMEKLSWEDARNFYDKWYAPNNAILVVSGDVSGEQVWELAKKIYGKIKKHDVPKRSRTTIPPFEAPKTVTLTDPVVRQPVIQKLYRVPSYRQNSGESLFLETLVEIMSGGPTSRLYKALVVEQKIASSASMGYRSNVWDDAELVISATPNPGYTVEDVEKALMEQIDILLDEGVSDDETVSAISRMQSSAIYARDSLQGPAMTFGGALTTGSKISDIEYWPQIIAHISNFDVNAVAQKYLSTESKDAAPPVTGYLLPPAQEPQENSDQSTGETE